MGLKATAKFVVRDAAVKGLLAKVAQGTFDGVTAAGELIMTAAKEKCPVDTGALQESIDLKVTRGIQNIAANRGAALQESSFGVTGIVAPHTDYAAYVEFGTGQRGAASTGAGEGPYDPNWPGMRAQPYMRPAFDEHKRDALDIIENALRDAVK